MQNDTSIHEITKRTERYWYEDGIWEIGFGSIILLLGGFFLLTARFDWNGPLSIALLLLQMAVIIGSFWVINRLVKFLKERLTYPRTGYVSYRKPAPTTRLKRALLTGLLSAAMAALVGALAMVQAAANRMPLVVSIIFAGTLIYLGYRFNLLRLYAVAALTILWGYSLSLLPLDSQNGTGYFFGGLGILMLLSGILTLLFYLRRTQPAGENQPNSDLPDDQS